MGKKAKSRGTKLRLDEFLGDQSANTVNIDGTAVELPSAPRATTLEIDVTQLPREPPFTAELVNLPYDVTEEHVWQFFGDLKISKIELPREDEDGRFKGKAFIIVDGKRDAAIETLAHVLAKNDNILMGRRVRIEIYQPRRDERRGGPSDDPNFGRSDRGGWRRDASPPPRRDDRGYGDRGGSSYGRDRDDRGGGGSGFDRDRRGGGGFDDRRGGGFDDRRGGGGGGGYDDRRGGGYDDRRGGGGFDDRRGGGGFDDRRGGGGGYEDRRGGYDRGDRYEDRGGGGGYRPSPSEDDRQWRRAAPEIPDRPDLSRREEQPRGGGTERPRLQLAARTKPVDESKATQKSASRAPSNPFGAAKAVDTSAKEKEIEQKLKATSLNDKPSTGGGAPPQKEFVKKLTAEERAAQKAEELKKRIEEGELDNEGKKEKAEIGTKSRFDLLDEECP